MPGGQQRRANLDMLVEKARNFEATSYKGLFHFVRYIEQLQKYDVDYGEATTDAPYNPNGSTLGIEGIVSPDGRILGKMGHTERYERNLMKNIAGEKIQDIFSNAVRYFTKR